MPECDTFAEPETWETAETDAYEECVNCRSGVGRKRGRYYYVAGRTTSYYEILCRAQGLPIRKHPYWRGYHEAMLGY